MHKDGQLDTAVLLRGVVCVVCIVCGGAAGRLDGGTYIFAHIEHGVKVFYHCVFAGAVQSVDKSCAVHSV